MKEKENETTQHRNPLCQIYRSAFQMDHGIRQIEATTGSGKSHVLGEEIFHDLQRSDHYFVITTTRLNNLSTYEDHFQRLGIGDLVYFARGNAERAADLLAKQRSRQITVPDEITRFKSWHDMERAKNRGPEGAEDLSRAYSNFANDVKQHYGFSSRERSAGSDRGSYDVSSYLSYFYDPESGMNVFLKDPGKYLWLKSAFPDIDGIQKRIVLLSVRKLDASIVLPFDVPFSRNWMEYLSASDRNTVFAFDESDSDKIDQKHSIIEDAYKGEHLELLSIMRDMVGHIRSSLTGAEGRLIREQMRVKEPDKYEAYIKELLSNCDQYDAKFHSAYPYRAEARLSEQRLFFYNTGHSIGMVGKNISGNKDTELCVEFDGMINRVVQRKKGESKATIEDLIQESIRIASRFKNLICAPIIKYRVAMIQPKEDNALFIDQQFYSDSVMGDFGFSPATREFIMGSGERYGNVLKKTAASSGSFYEDGLLYISMISPPESMVRMNATMINTTPEYKLIEIAQKHPVLLISATASSESFTNYNMDYLRSKLGAYFYPMTDKEKEDMRAYLRFDDLENNIRFHTGIIPDIVSDRKDKNHASIMPSDFSRYAFMLLSMREDPQQKVVEDVTYLLDDLYQKCGHDNYKFSVYYGSLWGYLHARLSGSNLMIEYRSRQMAYDGGDYSYLDLKDLYRGLDNHYWPGVPCSHHYFLSARSCRDEAGEYMGKRVQEDLPEISDKEQEHNLNTYIRMISEQYEKDGISFIVHTTYAASSVGVNFYAGIYPKDNGLYQYDLYSSDEAKQDFNGIILHQPTFLISQTRNGEEYYASYQIDRADRIYDLEEMTERGLIDQRRKEELLCNDGSTIGHEMAGYFETRRIIDQALGRLMRNTKKSRAINCVIDQNIAEALANTGSDILTPPIAKSAVLASMEHLARHHISLSDKEQTLLNRVNNLNKRAERRLTRYLLYRDLFGRMVNKERYVRERKISFYAGIDLSQETYDSLDPNEKAQYFKNPGVSEYYYQCKNDHRDITGISSVKKSGYIECSYRGANIDLMVQIPCLKEAMEKDGIPTEPCKDPVYSILPIVYNNDYKGYAGEYAVRVIAKSFWDIDLEEIEDEAAFELADFVFGNCLIDAKQYSFHFDKNLDVEEMLDKAVQRSVLLGKSRFVYIMPVMRIQDPVSQKIIRKEPESGKEIAVYIVSGLYTPDENGKVKMNEAGYEAFYEALFGGDEE